MNYINYPYTGYGIHVCADMEAGQPDPPVLEVGHMVFWNEDYQRVYGSSRIDLSEAREILAELELAELELAELELERGSDVPDNRRDTCLKRTTGAAVARSFVIGKDILVCDSDDIGTSRENNEWDAPTDFRFIDPVPDTVTDGTGYSDGMFLLLPKECLLRYGVDHVPEGKLPELVSEWEAYMRKLSEYTAGKFWVCYWEIWHERQPVPMDPIWVEGKHDDPRECAKAILTATYGNPAGLAAYLEERLYEDERAGVSPWEDEAFDLETALEDCGVASIEELRSVKDWDEPRRSSVWDADDDDDD